MFDRTLRDGVPHEPPEIITPPGVLSGPAARAALRRGIDRLADSVRPTLGPEARTVAVHDTVSGRPIEILDDAATILRRVIEIPDVYVNMGAMILRHTVWKESAERSPTVWVLNWQIGTRPSGSRRTWLRSATHGGRDGALSPRRRSSNPRR